MTQDIPEKNPHNPQPHPSLFSKQTTVSECTDQNQQNQQKEIDLSSDTSQSQKSGPEKQNEEPFDKKQYHNAIYKTIYLSVSFMLLFTAFNSAQNMVAQVYANLGYDNLGNIALFTIYFVYSIASFFGSKLVALASRRVIFFVSAFCYNTFIFAGFIAVHCPDSDSGDLPTECKQGVLYSYIIFTSMLVGLAASTIWISQGMYIEGLQQNMRSKGAIFLGIFWSINQSSQITGNTLSYLLFGLEDGIIIYFTTILIVGLVGMVMFIFLPSNNIQVKQKESPKVITIVNIMKLRETKPLMLYMAFQGIIIAFYSGFLFRLVQKTLTDEEKEDKNYSNQQTAFVFIFLGVSEFIAGYSSGKIVNKFNNYKLATVSCFVALVALILSIVGHFISNYEIIFVIAALWGFLDCFTKVVSQEIFMKDFPDTVEIFALFNFLLALSNAFTQILAILVTNDLAFIIICTVFQVITTIGTKFFKKPSIYAVKACKLSKTNIEIQKQQQQPDQQQKLQQA